MTEFRGFDRELHYWRYGDLRQYSDGTRKIITTDCIGTFAYEVDRETIGQFTGRITTNGTKIYKDDFLKIYDNYTDRTFSGVVKFNNCSFYIEDTQGVDHYRWTDYDILEVVGNVIDNPELMDT